ncbi:MAG: riboflavin biosynthesis protein RibF [Candidatus Cryosericum sp.]|nr:riboflavin biosynthesis protein RibF [bacterium]
MTSVYLSSSEFPGVASAVAIGAFDGFHLGHQRVIARLTDYAKKGSLATVIYTFRQNPKVVTRGVRGLLTTNSERVDCAAKAGIENIVLEDFSTRFQGMSAEVFVRDIIVARLNARVVVVGKDFRFGRARTGDVQLMSRILEESGRVLVTVDPVIVDGEVCSSSLIRAAVEEGNVERAAGFLGRPYSLEGVIVTGNRIGGRLGFPTANIEVPDPVKLVPGNGVYAVRGMIDEIAVNGVCNIGVRPTMTAASRRTVEVHLLDFDRKVYGHLASIEFIARLRPEIRFSSSAELVKQISQDVATARAVLG